MRWNWDSWKESNSPCLRNSNKLLKKKSNNRNLICCSCFQSHCLHTSLDETLSYVKSSNDTCSSDLVVVHPFINDIKLWSHSNVLKSLKISWESWKKKWPLNNLKNYHLIWNRNTMQYHTRGQILNMLVRQHFYGYSY